MTAQLHEPVVVGRAWLADATRLLADVEHSPCSCDDHSCVSCRAVDVLDRAPLVALEDLLASSLARSVAAR